MNIKICLFLFCLCAAGPGLQAQTDSASIHRFTLPAANGATIQFSAFAGKKILVVNTASLANNNNQLVQLQTLQQQQAANLVIVALPCTDFNNLEPEDSAALIYSHYQQAFGVSYPVAQKVYATGPAIHPVYRFLTRKRENGVMSSTVTKNFQKYLLDNAGRLIGVFDGETPPLSPVIINAINNN